MNQLARLIKENDAGLSDYTSFNVAGQLKIAGSVSGILREPDTETASIEIRFVFY